MKRIFGFFIIIGCLVFFNKGSAQETFRDNFNTASYSNNNGTQNFSSDWIESGDTDSGPTAQYIYITGSRLNFYYVWGETIRRSANLNGATTATLSFSWQTSGLTGSKGLRIQASNNGGASYTTIGTVSGNNSSGNFSVDISAYISSNTTLRFTNTGTNWDNNDFGYIDNFQIQVDQLSPVIEISDVTVNEGDGTANFTVFHNGADAPGPFTVDYTTTNGTAILGSDYTATIGILNFNGSSGDSDTFSVPIIDDGDFEVSETFTISFTGSSEPTADITDTATATINDNDVLGNTPLALFQKFDGYLDYTSAGGTLRTADNNTNACSVTTSSSGTPTSTIPGAATIERAYLYWSHSGYVPDAQVTLEGNTVDADVMYNTTLVNGGITLSFYGGVSDVTSIIQSTSNPGTNTYDFSGLTIDTSPNFCNTATVLGGWSLFIFYSEPSLPASTINLYQGFNGESNSSSSFTLSGFFAIGATGSQTSVLSWEGDQTLSNNELLTVTTGLGTFTLAGDGDNDGVTVNNPFNSTIFDNTTTPIVNNTTSYGVDLDTYDFSPFVAVGESSVTTTVQSGQDFIIMNALVLKVPSNLITGTVFEDVNYGGGAGRNLAIASGVGIENVSVELYDNTNTLVETLTTDASGNYTFGGIANGSYNVRAVNETVRSSRGGGSACATCYPVQTFRTDYASSTVTEITNEVGGTDPSNQDSGVGIYAGAQSLAAITIASEGAVGIDFGFNFNTIVNTNEDGQGSLEQFIINANNLDETGLDIAANGIFDPAAGDDTSIFMIPSSIDPLGRSVDGNFSSGYFDISISNGNPLSDILGDNTIIDGRTQTAYSGDTNSGNIGSGGSSVGTSAIVLPNFELPEIQIHRNGGDVLKLNANSIVVRNLSVYGNNNAAVQINGGSAELVMNLLGVNAVGVNAGDVDFGAENLGGSLIVDGNYVATNTESGIRIDGGSSTTIQNNHFFNNGDDSCDENINVGSGSGILIQQNLIEGGASLGIDAASTPGGLTITENTITGSGRILGNCGSAPENMGIELGGSNTRIDNNIIHSNGGAGLATTGSGTGNLFSQNSFYANGTSSDALGIDLAGDGITLNDGGDSDSGSNTLLNFPIVSSAYLSGNSLIVMGWSRPGTTLEFFFTDVNEGTATAGDNQLGFSVDYGEGQTYIATRVEGSGDDSDATVSTFNDVDGNTDNTNRFQFALPLSPGTVLGEMITATATLANSTSEFSPMSILKVNSVITNRRITYRVNQN